MTSRTNRAVLFTLLFGAIAVVILNTWLAFRSVDVLLESEFWVQHTLEVIGQVERIMSSAKDAETGNRGFLITGQDAYLAPYTQAVAELPAEVDRFKQLTSDNPVQQANAREMRAVLDQRLALLKQGIAERRSGDVDNDFQALTLSGTGKVEMDHLRTIADHMESAEQSLLILREAAAKEASLRARLTIGLASAMDFLLIILMFRYLQRERAMRVDSELAAERLAAARAQSEFNAIEARAYATRAEASAAEIQLLNATLEERVRLRTAELETTNRELEAFSYSVSHDLRAPLRTIDGFSLALEEDYTEAVDDVGRDYIRRVRTGVQRMGQLIDALLQLSRITRQELVREPFDLSEIAESVAADLQQSDPERELTFHIESGLPVNADPKLLRVALENLLGNAVKFSARVACPVIEVGWDPAARDRGAWFIRDNGAGFDMFYAAKLFNAFNRLHGDKDFKGSGIGLATVARVVRRHHGDIWADSVVGRGATFWFTLG